MMKITGSIYLLLMVLGFSQCNSQTKEVEMKTMDKTASTGREIVVDVRTREEWNEDGHADCSVNYPLDQFEGKIEELKNYDKVTLVCRSGNRAEMAKMKLVNAGYRNKVENLGSWHNISCAN